MTPHIARHSSSAPTAMLTQRSSGIPGAIGSPAQRKTPCGAMCGTRLPDRSGCFPFITWSNSPSATTTMLDSHCDMSMYCPSPVRSRW